MGEKEHPFESIERAFKRSVQALREAEVPFLLGGAVASWARGGPESRNDLDLMIKPEDAERALEALVGIGMEPERPAEEWLLKAWDDGVLVDLIFRPKGLEITDEVIDRGDEMDVLAIRVRVMAIEDVIVSKLLALGEHSLDLEPTLQISRTLREQVNWRDVRARTAESPYARAFLGLLDELKVIPDEDPELGSRSRVEVVS